MNPNPEPSTHPTPGSAEGDENHPTPPPLPEVPVTLLRLVDDLLKRPLALLEDVQSGATGVVVKRLRVIIAAAFALFGLVLAIFSGGGQYLWAPLKLIAGIAVSGAITLPSLYIFSCLNGHDVTIKSVAGVLVASLALVGLLLIGLTPVLWVFAQSSTSLPFLGALALLFWSGALAFGLSLLFKTGAALMAKRNAYLDLWVILFILVTLQMSTALRPLIGTSATILPTEKKFFLVHWFDEISLSSRETKKTQP